MVVDCVHKLINQFPLNQMIDRQVNWSTGSIGSDRLSIDRFPVWPTAAPPPFQIPGSATDCHVALERHSDYSDFWKFTFPTPR